MIQSSIWRVGWCATLDDWEVFQLFEWDGLDGTLLVGEMDDLGTSPG